MSRSDSNVRRGAEGNGRRWRPLLLALACVAFPAGEDARCGGPLLVEKGVPFRWSTSSPLALNPDQGDLGNADGGGFTGEEALELLEEAISRWNGVETSSLEIMIGAHLSKDIEGLDLKGFNAFVTRNDGTNPVIFDSDGSIIDALFGSGSGVLGVAGPSLVYTSSRTIVKGFAVLNGTRAQKVARSNIVAVMVHELGHLLNLGHSQVNGHRISGTIPGFSGAPDAADVETMFPLLLQSSESPHPMSSLHKDDVAALSALYPSEDFQAATATVSGEVLDIDGATPMQGINVVARNVEDPFADAVSSVSGHLAGAAPTDSTVQLLGKYELRGLTPGARYKVYIEEISAYFTGGSSVGPLDPPRDVDPTETSAFLEFYSGGEEGAEDPPDDPLLAEEIVVEAGGAQAEVDVIFNGVKPRLSSIQPPYASYAANQDVIVAGTNLLGTFSVRLEGDESIFLAAVEQIDSGRVRTTVPAGSMPGVYSVIAKTVRGENEPGEVEYRVTEPLPTIFSIEPASLQNDRARRVGVEGMDLLGTRSARLEAEGLPDVPLIVLRVFGSDVVLLEVPPGVFPASYAVRVTNTEGESTPAPQSLTIFEMDPTLSGTIDPDSAPATSSRTVTIEGQNLVGTSAVELVREGERISLSIQSTSLTEVVVTVPAGLDPGAYAISLTNSKGTVTGPTQYLVEPPRSGGGGCGAIPGWTGGGGGFELPAFLAIALAAALLRRRAPARLLEEETRT